MAMIWRLELARLLGHEPPEDLWRLASPWIEKLEQSKNLKRDLAEFTRWFNELEAKAQAPQKTREAEVRVPADRRGEALACIVADDAAQLPQVVSFRRDVLRGRLMSLEQIAPWVRRQAERGGPATHYARVPLTEKWTPAVEGKLWPPRPGISYDLDLLHFPNPEKVVESVPVRAGGTLQRLLAVAKFLARRHGWTEAYAVAFVLTGKTPAPVQGRVTVTMRTPYSALSTLTMELSPRLNPAEVARLYQKARTGELFGPAAPGLRAGAALPAERVKAMSDEHCELAVFIAQANDGRSWGRALAEWNRRRPEEKRESLPGFTRAAREAYQRVTGQPLEWQRKRGEHGEGKEERSVRPTRRRRRGGT